MSPSSSPSASPSVSLSTSPSASLSSLLISSLNEALAGGLGTIISSTLVYPLDYVKTRMQLPGSEISSLSGGVIYIIKREGFFTLYNGLGAEILKSTLQNFLYFFAYNVIKQYHMESIMRQQIISQQQRLYPYTDTIQRKSSYASMASPSPSPPPSMDSTLLSYMSPGMRYIYFRDQDEWAKTKRQKGIFKEGKAKVNYHFDKETKKYLPMGNGEEKEENKENNAPEVEKVSSPSLSPPQLSILSNLLIGIASGIFTQLFVNPVSVVQTRLITANKPRIASNGSLLSPSPPVSFLSLVNQLYITEGPSVFFSGIIPSFILTSNPSIQFLVFDRLKFLLLKFLISNKNKLISPSDANQQRNLSAAESFLFGAIAKIVATFATYPYIMAKIRMQYKEPVIDGVVSSNNTPKYNGALDVIYQILRADGITGLYKGITAQLLKSVLSTALMFMMKEKITQISQNVKMIIMNLRKQREGKGGPRRNKPRNHHLGNPNKNQSSDHSKNVNHDKNQSKKVN